MFWNRYEDSANERIIAEAQKYIYATSGYLTELGYSARTETAFDAVMALMFAYTVAISTAALTKPRRDVVNVFKAYTLVTYLSVGYQVNFLFRRIRRNMPGIFGDFDAPAPFKTVRMREKVRREMATVIVWVRRLFAVSTCFRLASPLAFTFVAGDGNYTMEEALPLPGGHLWPLRDIYGYLFAYAAQLLAVFPTVATVLTVVPYCTVPAIKTGAYFERLGEMLRELREAREEVAMGKGKKPGDFPETNRLKIIVKSYQQVRSSMITDYPFLKLTGELICFYVWILSILTLRGLLVTDGISFLSFVAFTAIAVPTAAQSLAYLYVICNLGETYTNFNRVLSNEVYDLKWYLMNSEQRKTILTFLTQISVDFQCKAYGILPMRLNFFTKILKNIYTIINVLTKWK